MRKVTQEVLKNCAENLLFELSEQSLNQLNDDFESLLIQIEFLKQIKDIDEKKAMSFPYEYKHSYLREDKQDKPLKAESVLKNATNTFADQIKVSKVIGE